MGSIASIFIWVTGGVGVADTPPTFSLGATGTAASEFRLDWSHQVGGGVLVGPVVITQSSAIDGVLLSGQGLGIQVRRRPSESLWGTGWAFDGRFFLRRGTLGFQGREGTFDFAELQGTAGYHYALPWIVVRLGLGFRWRGLASEYWLVGPTSPVKASLGTQAGAAPLIELGILKEF